MIALHPIRVFVGSESCRHHRHWFPVRANALRVLKTVLKLAGVALSAPIWVPVVIFGLFVGFGTVRYGKPTAVGRDAEAVEVPPGTISHAEFH